MDLLIENARISDDRPLVDIAIAGGRIAALGPRIGAGAAHRIDADGRVVLPGFVEPHLHVDKALLRGRGPAGGGTLADAIRLTGELKARRDRADMRDRSRLVLDMALAHGTVAIRAHPDVDPLQGLLGVESGLEMRDEYRSLLDLELVAFPQEGILKAPPTLALMEEAMRMGASVVGGCPYNERTWEDARRHVDIVFDLAQRFDAPIDMHADFADEAKDPRFTTARYIAEKAIATGYEGRVSLGHVTSLAALACDEARRTIELLSAAGITIVTLPATDLYLGGRDDERARIRGLTPVRTLRRSGVEVTLSSNNVRNAFTPFGNGDMLQIANLLAHAAQLGGPDEQADVLRMATSAAARSIGRPDHGLAEGCRADLVILDSRVVADVLADIPARLWVVKGGRVTVQTTHRTVIHRDPARART